MFFDHTLQCVYVWGGGLYSVNCTAAGSILHNFDEFETQEDLLQVVRLLLHPVCLVAQQLIPRLQRLDLQPRLLQLLLLSLAKTFGRHLVLLLFSRVRIQHLGPALVARAFHGARAGQQVGAVQLALALDLQLVVGADGGEHAHPALDGSGGHRRLLTGTRFRGVFFLLLSFGLQQGAYPRNFLQEKKLKIK